MRKLYYFSDRSLRFVEIKKFKSKMLLVFTVSVLFFSSLLFLGFIFLSSIINPDKSAASLELENQILKAKLVEVSEDYKDLNKELEKITSRDNELRLAVNLEPIDEETRLLGIGGSSIESDIDFLSDDEIDLRKALTFIDEVTRKIEFEKEQYKEVELKLNQNEKLFASIPAIRPTTGYFDFYSFGMRRHPILKVNRMHDGIDIITDRGTPVYAPGGGKIDFVGRKGGYGLAVEIDHGFGYRTLYAHLSKTEVKVGERIERGELIAKTGNSGLSSGPHLHYEVHHNGVKLDPVEFFFDDLGFFELTKKDKNAE